jgi:hypothetical protein
MAQHARRPRLRPVRRARLVMTLLVVVGTLLVSIAGGWFGYELGAAHTDARVNALEADQPQRAARPSAPPSALATGGSSALPAVTPSSSATSGSGAPSTAVVAQAAVPGPTVTRPAAPALAAAPITAPIATPAATPTAAPAPVPTPPAATPPAVTPPPLPVRPTSQAATPTPPAATPPAATPSPPGSGGGLICLPILGCLL